MSVIVKRIDPAAQVYGREVSFVSAVDFVQDDVIDINASFGGAAVNITVETAAASTCTFRVNSMNKRYPLLSTAKSLGYPAPDLQNETIWMNANAPTYSLTAGQVITLDDFPVSNLEFTAVVGTITVKARG